MPRQGKNPYKRPDSPYWYIWWLDAAGIERRESTRTRQLSNARRCLSKRREEAENARAGLIDPFAESRRRPLSEFVEQYREHLIAHERAPRYVREVIRQLRAAIGACGAATVRDFTIAAVQPFLTTVRASRSAKTWKEYVGTLKAFGRWLHESRFWPENAFAILRAPARRDGDRAFRRIGLNLADVTRLAESAQVRGLQEYVRSHAGRQPPDAAAIEEAGRNRSVLYWTAATTGLRASELAALTWADLHLDGKDPHLELDGRHTKNRRDAHVPLQGFLAHALAEARRNRATTLGRPIEQREHVFSVPADLAEHVRRDAVHAGILPDHHPGHRRLDFHALRHSCVHLLRDLGVAVEIVQRVMRHSDIRLTLQIYGSREQEEVARQMRDVVPAPRIFAPPDSPASGSSLGSSRVPTATSRDEPRRTDDGGPADGTASEAAG